MPKSSPPSKRKRVEPTTTSTKEDRPSPLNAQNQKQQDQKCQEDEAQPDEESSGNQNNSSHKASSTKTGSTTVQPLQFTVRNPQWTYLKLQLISSGPQQAVNNGNIQLDPITARTYLTSALNQFLGLMGSSIGIDVLKIIDSGVSRTQAEGQSQSRDHKTEPFLWIRVPRDDAPAVVAALSSWVGSSGSGLNTGGTGGGNSNSNLAWRICAKGNFLTAIVNGSGRDLFN